MRLVSTDKMKSKSGHSALKINLWGLETQFKAIQHNIKFL